MSKDTGITYVNKNPNNFDETVQLYKSVGWIRYTNFPDELMTAIQNSTYVISAYKNDQLIGLIRGLSDSVSIHLIQDLLVHPKYQRMGIGRALLKRALTLYPRIHKHLLLTDDEPFQRLFYESLSFQNLELSQPKLNAYIKMS
ncbi:MAG: GNAT family N-acetyltransferase [Alphaproteobacteria bacterium]|nr:GNAT family N-acetyltransferase [Alphaproteobacteria bacterium]